MLSVKYSLGLVDSPGFCHSGISGQKMVQACKISNYTTNIARMHE